MDEIDARVLNFIKNFIITKEIQTKGSVMKISNVCVVSALLFTSPCLANDPVQITKVQNDEYRRHLDFEDGYTNLVIHDYHIKIIAEQRFTDNLVQVIAIPTEQGVRFRIANIQFETAPPGVNLSGPVAKVEGFVSFRSSEDTSRRMREIVPVQIKSVDEFSISEDEASMQGYDCMRKEARASS